MTMARATLKVATLSVAMMLPFSALSQSPPPSPELSAQLAETGTADQICLALANNIKPDVSIQGSTREKFVSIQRVIAADSFKSWDIASSAKLDLNISVPDYVDGVLGTQSNSSNWGVNRDRFLKTDFSQVASSASSITVVNKTSEGIVQSIVNCAQIVANQNGFFGTLASVAPGRDGFVIRLFRKLQDGDSDWLLRGLSGVPADTKFKCNEQYEQSSQKNPKPIHGLSVLISCSKSSDHALTVSANTNVGTAGPFTIIAVQDDLSALRDRVANIEAAAAAIVPRQTVAYFDGQACPPGWEAIQAAMGRYIVGLQPGGQLEATVGQALTNKEDRPTGAHSHPISATGVGGHGAGLQGGNDCCSLTTVPISGTGSIGVEGTNAPYIQLMACRKQ